MNASNPRMTGSTYAIYIDAKSRAEAAVILQRHVGGRLLDIAELLQLVADHEPEEDPYSNDWEAR